MEDTIYYISEASKKVQVEPHVLRYWEEELQLGIKRNEMGHRCYTQKDIETFSRIRLLKEQGLQLKAIRLVLQGENGFLSQTEDQKSIPEEKETQKEGESLEEKVEDMVMKKAKKYMVTMSKGKETVVEMPREELQEYQEPEDEKTKKAARLQYLLQHMVTEAVKSANQEMCTEIKESILKELDYQFRQQEERDEAHWKQEEEHYRKIDEMIRQRHSPKERFINRGKK